MRIINCHIEGFGKLNDTDFDFSDKVNVIMAGNGYGKTTLAVFLKVMFYGFDDENKRGLKDKEREKYRPWNKSTYGGRIVFEYDGREFEVSRVFGKNEGDDFFEIRNTETNLLCNEFSGKDLGTKIFGIDKDSFYRTVFIYGRDRKLTEDYAGDSIRARLGNLTDATDDINNFKSVCDRIKDRMNELTPDRKTGKIKKLKTEISELKNDTRNIEVIDRETEILEEQIGNAEDKLKRLDLKIKNLREEESKSIKMAALLSKKETYDSLVAELEESKKQAGETGGIFKKRIPSKEELKKQEERISEVSHYVKEMEQKRFYKDDVWHDLERRFADEIPSEEEIRRRISDWNELNGNESKLNLSSKELNEAVDKHTNELIESKNAEYLEEYKKAETQRKKKSGILVGLASAFILACFVLFALCRMQNVILVAVGSAMALCSAVCVILIYVLKLNRKSELKKASKEDLSENVDECKEASEIRDNIEALKLRNEEIEEGTKSYLERFQVPFSKETLPGDLWKLSDDAQRFRDGLKSIKEYDEISLKCESAEEEIEAFYADIGVEGGNEPSSLINVLQDTLAKLEQINLEIERKTLIIENYKADNNIGELEEIAKDSPRDPEDIREEMQETEEEAGATDDVLSGYRRRLEDKIEMRERLSLLENEAAEKTEEIAELEKRYEILGLTLDFLIKAKDGLSNKYTGPTMEAYKRYYEYFLPDKDTYRIDTDLNLTKTEEGQQRETRELSTGLKDVTDFCMRLALIDTMYSGEKPFIVMDDPFVNMDDAKKDSAKKLLKEAGEKYQIIYFTCRRD